MITNGFSAPRLKQINCDINTESTGRINVKCNKLFYDVLECIMFVNVYKHFIFTLMYISVEVSRYKAIQR